METTLVLVLVVLLLLGRSSYCYSPCPTGLGLNSTNPTLVPTVLVVVVEVLVIMLSVVGVVVVEVVDVLVLVALVVSSLLLPPLPSSGPLSGALHLDLSNATATVSAPPRPPRSSRGPSPCGGGVPVVGHLSAILWSVSCYFGWLWLDPEAGVTTAAAATPVAAPLRATHEG